MPRRIGWDFRRVEGGNTSPFSPGSLDEGSGAIPLVDPVAQTVNAAVGVLAFVGNSSTVTNQDGFEIERREDGGSWHFQAFDTASPYVDNSSLTVGVLYEYRVRQWTSGVAGSWSNISGLTFAASGQTINAAVGVMNAVGNTATITSHSLVSAANGSMTMTGNTATISSGAMVNAAVGVMTLTGNTSTITSHSLVNAAVGSMGMVGNTATITSSGAEQTFSQDSVTYLLRDKFSSAQNPLVDGNASEGAGVGYRDVTGTSFYADSKNRLRGGNNSSEGKIVYKRDSTTAGWNRVGGRTFAALITPDDGEGNVSLWLAETAGTLNGYGIVMTDQGFQIYEPDGTQRNDVTLNSDNPMRAIPYLVGITLNDTQGAVYWVSAMQDMTFSNGEWAIPAYPDARTLFVSTLGTFSTVHPTIRASSGFSYPGGVAIEDVRLFDIASWDGEDGMALVADRFNRADSSTSPGGSWVEDNGNWGISSNKAYTTTGGRVSIDAGVSDYMIACVIDVATAASDNFGVLLRRNSADAGDYAYLAAEDSLNVYFKRWLNPEGFQNTDYSTYMNWQNTSTVRFIVAAQGNSARAWFTNPGGNNITAEPFSIGTTHTTGTYVGLYGDTNTRWDYFAAYPIEFALPSEFNKGAYPKQHDVGTLNINYDQFTGSNGSALTSHTPNTGGNWTAVNGTWTIENNKAEAAGASGDLLATVSSGYADVKLSTTVTTPASYSQLRSGFVLRYADINNHVRIRMFVDDVNQLNNDEIEIQEVIGGSANVVHKCYLGNFYGTNATYTLSATVVGDVLHVYLDNELLITTYLSNSALLTGTAHGFYREGGSADVAWDEFAIVRAGSVFVDTNVASLVSSGNTATITSHSLVSANVGSAAFSGNTATVTSHSLVNANVGTGTFAGNTASITSHSLVSANVGSAAFSGNTATITSASLVNAAVGSAAFAGNTASITSHSRIDANVGSATFSGNTATISSGAMVNANVGALASVGNQAVITSHSLINASVGVGNFVGNTASVSAGSSPQIINAAVGLLASSGNTATITSHSRVDAANGTLVASGNQATITSHSRVSAANGTLTATGNQATITSQSRVAANVGTIVSVGNTATIQLGNGPQVVNAAVGLLSSVGNQASVIGGPVIVSAQAGVLASSGLHADVYTGDNPIVYVRINTLRRRQE